MNILHKLGISTVIGPWWEEFKPWEAYTKSVQYITSGYKAKQFTVEDYSDMLVKLHDMLMFTAPKEEEEDDTPNTLTVRKLMSILRHVPPDYEVKVGTYSEALEVRADDLVTDPSEQAFILLI